MERKAIPHASPVSAVRVTATAVTAATVHRAMPRQKARLQSRLPKPRPRSKCLPQTLASSRHAAATSMLLRLRLRQSKRLLLQKCRHPWLQKPWWQRSPLWQNSLSPCKQNLLLPQSLRLPPWSL